MSKVRQTHQPADGRADGGSDYGLSGAHQDSGIGAYCRGKKGEFQKTFEQLKKSGYVRVRVDGEMRELEEEIKLTKTKKHDIEVVIDRIILKEGVEGQSGQIRMKRR